MTAETPLISWSVGQVDGPRRRRHPRRRRPPRPRRSGAGRRRGPAPRRRRSPCSTCSRCAAGCASSRTTSTARRPTASTCCSVSGSADHAAYAAALPLDHPPGTVWNYSSGTTNILCRIARRPRRRRRGRDAGLPRPAPVRPGRHVRRRRPRSTPPAPGSDRRTSTPRPASSPGSASCTAATGWSAASGSCPRAGSTTPAPPSPTTPRPAFGYGRHWWTWPDQPGSVAAHGYEGQYVVVLPEHEAVLVHLGKTDASVRDRAGRPPAPHHRHALSRSPCSLRRRRSPGWAGHGRPECHARCATNARGRPPLTGVGRPGRHRVRRFQRPAWTPVTDDAGLRRLPGSLETGELPPIERDPSQPVRRQRIRPVRLTIKVLLIVAVVYFLVIPLIPDLRDAAHRPQPGAADLPGRRGRRCSSRLLVLLRPADPLGARRAGRPDLARCGCSASR